MISPQGNGGAIRGESLKLFWRAEKISAAGEARSTRKASSLPEERSFWRLAGALSSPRII